MSPGRERFQAKKRGLARRRHAVKNIKRHNEIHFRARRAERERDE
jgi:hypothetical protein